MRISVVEEDLGHAVGGIARSALELAEVLTRRGHAVSLLYGRRGPLLERWSRIADFSYDLHGLVCWSRRQMLRAARAHAHAWLYTLNWLPDVVHIHSWRHLKIGLAVAHAARAPLALHLRTMPPVLAPQYIRLLDRVDIMLAISEAVKRAWTDTGLPSHRIVTGMGGISTAAIGSVVSSQEQRELRGELGLPADRPILVYAGRVIAEKGVRELCGAVRRLNSRRVLLVVVGDAGPGAHRLEDFRAILEEIRRVGGMHVPALTSAVRYIRAADVCVLPSYSEAMGRAALESLACGVPVVATRAGGLMEIMRGDLSRYMVNPRDEESLANGIAAALDTPPPRHQLLSRAAEYDVEVVGDRVEKVFCQLLSDRAAR